MITTPVEETVWDELLASLEKRFTVWNLDHSQQRAKSIVNELRRSGWRVPLPDGSAPPRPGRPLHPEIVKRNIQKCRDELRAMRGAEDAG